LSDTNLLGASSGRILNLVRLSDNNDVPPLRDVVL
jgi:hypothetical protein